jgi:hypothetical protein
MIAHCEHSSVEGRESRSNLGDVDLPLQVRHLSNTVVLVALDTVAEDLLQHLRHRLGLDQLAQVRDLSNMVFLVDLDTVVEDLLQHLGQRTWATRSFSLLHARSLRYCSCTYGTANALTRLFWSAI